MAAWRENSWLILVSILFIALLGYTIWIDSWYGYLLPFGLLTLFVALFYTEYTFFFILAATPLSINIEEYTDSFGLFLPTEPLLFGTMLLLLMQSLKYKVFPLHMMHSPIIWTVGLYLLVIFFTAIVSSDPVVSFKFLLARLWFIVPVLGYGTNVFKDVKKTYSDSDTPVTGPSSVAIAMVRAPARSAKASRSGRIRSRRRASRR